MSNKTIFCISHEIFVFYGFGCNTFQILRLACLLKPPGFNEMVSDKLWKYISVVITQKPRYNEHEYNELLYITK